MSRRGQACHKRESICVDSSVLPAAGSSDSNAASRAIRIGSRTVKHSSSRDAAHARREDDAEESQDGYGSIMKRLIISVPCGQKACETDLGFNVGARAEAMQAFIEQRPDLEFPSEKRFLQGQGYFTQNNDHSFGKEETHASSNFGQATTLEVVCTILKYQELFLLILAIFQKHQRFANSLTSQQPMFLDGQYIVYDWSENGCSNTPEMNLTLRIRSTASSIRDIGICPDSTKNTMSSKNFSNLCGIIICRWLNAGKSNR
ncbi:hypothetical protein U9M48_044180 [Paspalum notatum var. saurae]|uniref:Uncharacterized protein n=1 Tax=Paspalum notatum var. saurae TaxID=547442 RepID=A0AAQ3UYL2_PASNO